MTFAEKVIAFNISLQFSLKLPENIGIMNPFAENPDALKTASAFYHKFYNDEHPRTLILGINPGRFGAGITGIPFTDTKRLTENCELELPGVSTYELSSVFVYEVIIAYGGVKAFYNDFYISSVCPLGFVIKDEKGREKNYNYYDSKALQEIAMPFILKTIKDQIAMGIDTSVCYCLGTGKNYKFLHALNEEMRFFKKIVPLEHPRYIMQYKSKQKEGYVEKYITLLKLH